MPKIERKWTNTKNLPQILANAIMNDKYDSGKSDISVTSLLDSPRARILNKRHAADVETDVSSMFASPMGTAFHHFMELSDETCRRKIKLYDAVGILKNILSEIKAGNDWSKRDEVVSLINNLEKFTEDEYPEFAEDVVVEIRLFIEVAGWVLSGQFDRLEVTLRDDKGRITHAKMKDYKQVSVFAYKNPMDIEKWTKQQNIYRWMLWKLHKINVVELAIVMVFRDWSATKAEISGPSYPPTWGDEIKLELIPIDEIEDYVVKRINKHRQAEEMTEDEFDELVKCTKKDVWLRDESFVVKKKGGVRALPGGAFATMKDAESFIAANQSSHKEELIVEHRPGSPTRCLKYCAAKDYCTQFQTSVHAKQG